MHCLIPTKSPTISDFFERAAPLCVGKMILPKQNELSKGDYGNSIERMIGLGSSNTPTPDFFCCSGSTLEIKSSALRTLKNGTYSLGKLKVTGTTSDKLLNHSFEQHAVSHKLHRWALFTHAEENGVTIGKSAHLFFTQEKDAELWAQIKSDYYNLQMFVAVHGWESLSSKEGPSLGKVLCLGTSGHGKNQDGATNRSFYLRGAALPKFFQKAQVNAFVDAGFLWSFTG
jgi:hypothetical protein